MYITVELKTCIQKVVCIRLFHYFKHTHLFSLISLVIVLVSTAAVSMAHRMRSRTADSAENKKTKGTPRRLTEKIAIMRRREHEQSAAFQKAMKSIFEVGSVNDCHCGIVTFEPLVKLSSLAYFMRFNGHSSR